MSRAAARLIEDARALKVTRSCETLSAALGCEVTPHHGRAGHVEARGLPGAYCLVGTPEEVADEGRRVLLRQWLAVLGRQQPEKEN
jgi:hypothetical protein